MAGGSYMDGALMPNTPGVQPGRWMGAGGRTTGGVAEKFTPDQMFRGQVFNWLKNQAGGGGSASGGRNPFLTNLPKMDRSPIWTPQMTQEEINKSAANTDRSAATQIRGGIQGQASHGYGVGAGSPIAATMRQMALGQAAGTNSRMASDTRKEHAVQNRRLLYDVDKAELDAQAQLANAWNGWWNIQNDRNSWIGQAMAGLI